MKYRSEIVFDLEKFLSLPWFQKFKHIWAKNGHPTLGYISPLCPYLVFLQLVPMTMSWYMIRKLHIFSDAENGVAAMSISIPILGHLRAWIKMPLFWNSGISPLSSQILSQSRKKSAKLESGKVAKKGSLRYSPLPFVGFRAFWGNWFWLAFTYGLWYNWAKNQLEVVKKTLNQS